MDAEIPKLDADTFIRIKETIILRVRKGMDMKDALDIPEYKALGEEGQKIVLSKIKIIQSL